MKKYFFILLLTLVSCISLSTITVYANTITGTLDATDALCIRYDDPHYTDVYTFTLDTRTSIEIVMKAEFGKVLNLYNQSRPGGYNRVADNSTSSAADRGIGWITLDAGTYCIEVTSYDPKVTGAYDLRSSVELTQVNFPAYQYSGTLDTTDALCIRYDDPHYTDVYTFTLDVRTSIEIVMKAEFGKVLNLYNQSRPEGYNRVADNSTSSAADRGVGWITLNAGTYCIEVTSYDPKVTGAYDLRSSVELTLQSGTTTTVITTSTTKPTTTSTPGGTTTYPNDLAPPVIGAVTTAECSISICIADDVAVDLLGTTVIVKKANSGVDITPSLTRTNWGDGTTIGVITFTNLSSPGYYLLEIVARDKAKKSTAGNRPANVSSCGTTPTTIPPTTPTTSIQTTTTTAIINYNLSIIINTTGKGTVQGQGINCGSDCQEIYDSGTTVKLTATAASGWAFEYWDDGAVQYKDNPINVTMDGNKNIVAKFIPQNNIFALTQNDSVPLGSRVPLLLVHGDNNEDNKNKYRWGDFIGVAQKDAAFNNKYKMYLFRWDHKWTNLENGLALGCAIDGVAELTDKEIMILAHSRGGIISRYYMNRYKTANGTYQGEAGGKRIKYLVTLATPHRGSPLADQIWMQFSFDYNYPSPIAAGLSMIYFNNDKLWSESNQYLLWDDADNELTNDRICWASAIFPGKDYCSFLMSNSSDLLKLNQEEEYFSKIIAYGGYNYLKTWEVATITFIISVRPQLLLQLISNDHFKLNLTGYLLTNMPIIPNEYNGKSSIDGNAKPFQANDGMVPLTSALCLKSGANDLFKIDPKTGDLVSDKQEVEKLVQVKKAKIINARNVDHLRFLDDSNILKNIINDLKTY